MTHWRHQTLGFFCLILLQSYKYNHFQLLFVASFDFSRENELTFILPAPDELQLFWQLIFYWYLAVK